MLGLVGFVTDFMLRRPIFRIPQLCFDHGSPFLPPCWASPAALQQACRRVEARWKAPGGALFRRSLPTSPRFPGRWTRPFACSCCSVLNQVLLRHRRPIVQRYLRVLHGLIVDPHDHDGDGNDVPLGTMVRVRGCGDGDLDADHDVDETDELLDMLRFCRNCSSDLARGLVPIEALANWNWCGPRDPDLLDLWHMERQLMAPYNLFMTVEILPRGAQWGRNRLAVILPTRRQWGSLLEALDLPNVDLFYAARPQNRAGDVEPQPPQWQPCRMPSMLRAFHARRRLAPHLCPGQRWVTPPGAPREGDPDDLVPPPRPDDDDDDVAEERDVFPREQRDAPDAADDGDADGAGRWTAAMDPYLVHPLILHAMHSLQPEAVPADALGWATLAELVRAHDGYDGAVRRLASSAEAVLAAPGLLDEIRACGDVEFRNQRRRMPLISPEIRGRIRDAIADSVFQAVFDELAWPQDADGLTDIPAILRRAEDALRPPDAPAASPATNGAAPIQSPSQPSTSSADIEAMEAEAGPPRQADDPYAAADAFHEPADVPDGLDGDELAEALREPEGGDGDDHEATAGQLGERLQARPPVIPPDPEARVCDVDEGSLLNRDGSMNDGHTRIPPLMTNMHVARGHTRCASLRGVPCDHPCCLCGLCLCDSPPSGMDGLDGRLCQTCRANRPPVGSHAADNDGLQCSAHPPTGLRRFLPETRGERWHAPPRLPRSPSQPSPTPPPEQAPVPSDRDIDDNRWPVLAYVDRAMEAVSHAALAAHLRDEHRHSQSVQRDPEDPAAPAGSRCSQDSSSAWTGCDLAPPAADCIPPAGGRPMDVDGAGAVDDSARHDPEDVAAPPGDRCSQDSSSARSGRDPMQPAADSIPNAGGRPMDIDEVGADGDDFHYDFHYRHSPCPCQEDAEVLSFGADRAHAGLCPAPGQPVSSSDEQQVRGEGPCLTQSPRRAGQSPNACGSSPMEVDEVGSTSAVEEEEPHQADADGSGDGAPAPPSPPAATQDEDPVHISCLHANTPIEVRQGSAAVQWIANDLWRRMRDPLPFQARLGVDYSPDANLPAFMTDWVQEPPVDATREECIEENVFFNLLSHGSCGNCCPRRPRNIPITRYVQMRLLQADDRFRRDPMWILWAQAMLVRNQVLDSVHLYMRHRRRAPGAGGTQPTASEILQRTADWQQNHPINSRVPGVRPHSELDSMLRQLEDLGVSPFLRKIQGTQPFWSSVRGDLDSMIRQVGVPCLYQSLNPPRPVERPEFFVSVDPEQYPDVDAVRATARGELARFVEEHPVEWVLHQEKEMLETFRRMYSGECWPAGVHGRYRETGRQKRPLHITDHFIVVEEQQRGYLHFHLLLWAQDAPSLATDDGLKEFPEWWDDVVGARACLPEGYSEADCTREDWAEEDRRRAQGLEPTARLIWTTMHHQCHPDHCGRSPGASSHHDRGARSRPCRYSFARPFRRQPGTDVTGDPMRQKYWYRMHRPTQRDRWLNQFQPQILSHWRGNMDIQPCCSGFAVVRYITDYMSKGHSAGRLQQALSQIVREMGPDFHAALRSGSAPQIRQAMHRLCFAVAKERTVSLQEASWLCLGRSLAMCSRNVVWLDCRERASRSAMVRTRADLEALARDDPQSDNVFYDGWVELYVRRPRDLDRLSLLGFVRMYDRSHPGRQLAQLNADGSVTEWHGAGRPMAPRRGGWTAGLGAASRPEDDDEGGDPPRQPGHIRHPADVDPSCPVFGLSDEYLRAERSYIELQGTGRRLRLRASPAIVRVPYFNALLEPDAHYHQLLMLHVPFRQEEELLAGGLTAQEAFHGRGQELWERFRAAEPGMAMGHLDRLYTTLRGFGQQQGQPPHRARDEEAARRAGEDLAPEVRASAACMQGACRGGSEGVAPPARPQAELPPPSHQPDQPPTSDPGHAAPDEGYSEMSRCRIPDQEYFEMLRVLGATQLELLRLMTHVFQARQLRHHVHCLLHIGGGPGTGKSYLVRAFKEFLERHHEFERGAPSDDSQPAVLVGTPTGLAAAILGDGAQTFHQVFGLRPMSGTTDQLAVCEDRQQDVARVLRRARCLILDEVSMVSQRSLDLIDQRCRIIRGNSAPFGDLDVFCFGDLNQLPPVGGSGPFRAAIWQMFAFHELEQNYRQDQDAQLLLDLREIAAGRYSDAIEARLMERVQCQRRGVDLLPDAPCLCPLRRQVWYRCNEGELRAMRQPGSETRYSTMFVGQERGTREQQLRAAVSAEVRDDHHGDVRPAGPEERMLASSISRMRVLLRLTVGQQVRLTANIEARQGQVNGLPGIVCGFEEERPPSGDYHLCQDLLRADTGHRGLLGVWFRPTGTTRVRGLRRMPDRVGGGMGLLIRPYSLSLTGRGGCRFTIRQLPLLPGYASTIHGYQGVGLDELNVLLDETGHFAPGIGLVALSRARSYDGLRLIAAPTRQNFAPRPDILCEMARLRQLGLRPLLDQGVEVQCEDCRGRGHSFFMPGVPHAATHPPPCVPPPSPSAPRDPAGYGLRRGRTDMDDVEQPARRRRRTGGLQPPPAARGPIAGIQARADRGEGDGGRHRASAGTGQQDGAPFRARAPTAAAGSPPQASEMAARVGATQSCILVPALLHAMRRLGVVGIPADAFGWGTISCLAEWIWAFPWLVRMLVEELPHELGGHRGVLVLQSALDAPSLWRCYVNPQEQERFQRLMSGPWETVLRTAVRHTLMHEDAGHAVHQADPVLRSAMLLSARAQAQAEFTQLPASHFPQALLQPIADMIDVSADHLTHDDPANPGLVPVDVGASVVGPVRPVAEARGARVSERRGAQPPARRARHNADGPVVMSPEERAHRTQSRILVPAMLHAMRLLGVAGIPADAFGWGTIRTLAQWVWAFPWLVLTIADEQTNRLGGVEGASLLQSALGICGCRCYIRRDRQNEMQRGMPSVWETLLRCSVHNTLIHEASSHPVHLTDAVTRGATLLAARTQARAEFGQVEASIQHPALIAQVLQMVDTAELGLQQPDPRTWPLDVGAAVVGPVRPEREDAAGPTAGDGPRPPLTGGDARVGGGRGSRERHPTASVQQHAGAPGSGDGGGAAAGASSSAAASDCEMEDLLQGDIHIGQRRLGRRARVTAFHASVIAVGMHRLGCTDVPSVQLPERQLARWYWGGVWLGEELADCPDAAQLLRHPRMNQCLREGGPRLGDVWTELSTAAAHRRWEFEEVEEHARIHSAFGQWPTVSPQERREALLATARAVHELLLAAVGPRAMMELMDDIHRAQAPGEDVGQMIGVPLEVEGVTGDHLLSHIGQLFPGRNLLVSPMVEECVVCCSDVGTRPHAREVRHGDGSCLVHQHFCLPCLLAIMWSRMEHESAAPPCPLCRGKISHVDGLRWQELQRCLRRLPATVPRPSPVDDSVVRRRPLAEVAGPVQTDDIILRPHHLAGYAMQLTGRCDPQGQLLHDLGRAGHLPLHDACRMCGLTISESSLPPRPRVRSTGPCSCAVSCCCLPCLLLHAWAAMSERQDHQPSCPVCDEALAFIDGVGAQLVVGDLRGLPVLRPGPEQLPTLDDCLVPDDLERPQLESAQLDRFAAWMTARFDPAGRLLAACVEDGRLDGREMQQTCTICCNDISDFGIPRCPRVRSTEPCACVVRSICLPCLLVAVWTSMVEERGAPCPMCRQQLSAINGRDTAAVITDMEGLLDHRVGRPRRVAEEAPDPEALQQASLHQQQALAELDPDPDLEAEPGVQALLWEQLRGAAGPSTMDLDGDDSFVLDEEV